jgi:hypothetical protein
MTFASSLAYLIFYIPEAGFEIKDVVSLNTFTEAVKAPNNFFPNFFFSFFGDGSRFGSSSTT